MGNADGTSSIDSKSYLSTELNKFFAGLFGKAEWDAVVAQWKAYNNIFNTSSQVYQNLRSIHNDSQELLNQNRNYTAELGNALVDEGIVGENNWSYKDPNQKIKSKTLRRLDAMSRGLEGIDSKLQAVEMLTSSLLSIAQEAKEIKDNVDELGKAITDANNKAKADRNTAVEGLEIPNFNPFDFFPE